MLIYMAAAENSDIAGAVAVGAVRNAFTSYFYMRKMGDVLKRMRKHCKRVIVDCGAHTFFAQLGTLGVAGTGNNWKREEPEAYFTEYLAWLKTYANDLDYFLELDIGDVVGQAQVEKWRERIRKAGLAEKCIIGWHPKAEPLEHFLNVARRWPSRYVGIEGLRHHRPSCDYVDVVTRLYRLNVRAHGFAMVKRRFLDLVPFYSADSISFKGGVLYGADAFHNPRRSGMLSEFNAGVGFGYVNRRAKRADARARERRMAAAVYSGFSLDTDSSGSPARA